MTGPTSPKPGDLAGLADAAAIVLTAILDLTDDDSARRSLRFAIDHARTAERRLRRIKTNTDEGENQC